MHNCEHKKGEHERSPGTDHRLELLDEQRPEPQFLEQTIGEREE